MMSRFEFAGLPSQVLFGAGSIAELPKALQSLGAKHVFCISSGSRQALAQLVAQGAGLPATYCPIARQHVPVEVVEEAHKQLQDTDCNLLLAVGGGSSIGLAKVLALRTGLQIVAVPTTYSGSEMTPVYGITENGKKQNGRAAVVQPKVVIYDPALSQSLPQRTAAASAVNALAHSVEALYATNKNPVISLLAQESVSSLGNSLKGLSLHAIDAAIGTAMAGSEDANSKLLDLDAHTAAFYGAWLSGSCLGAVTMGLHHKACHVIGGMFNTPHADTHTVLLPYVTHFNRHTDAEAYARLQTALGVNGPELVGPAIQALAKNCGLPTTLAELGLNLQQIELAANDIAGAAYANPRPVNRAQAVELLTAALQGKPMNAGDFPL